MAMCFELYQLLISMLVNYGKALDKLAGADTNDSKQPNEQNLVEMGKHAQNILEYG